MLNQTEIRQLIERQIQDLLLDPDTDDGSEDLVRIGLNSITLAQLLIELETELGVDPFQDGVSITDMRTIDDLVQAYTEALAGRTVTAPSGA
ncbi:phosphopantetheine-binding protein [Streptomyces sp. WELS2]|uniref:phosphopantetheine-binding protein n=1 Tax=Streptomyces sp. WELS2 TaxID=2749435 RepID=UPI0015EFF0DE|nr:phosphopantetheine-binding protein [Streptomyces sp. WELS2]